MSDWIKSVFTGVWLVRLAVGVVLSSGTAYFISFAVSDYVVAANTSGLAIAFNSLEATLARLDQGIRENTAAVNDLRDQMTALMVESGLQGVRLGSLATDVEKIKSAVEGAGIDIKAGYGLETFLAPDQQDWNAIQTKFGLDGTSPVFLQISPPK